MSLNPEPLNIKTPKYFTIELYFYPINLIIERYAGGESHHAPHPTPQTYRFTTDVLQYSRARSLCLNESPCVCPLTPLWLTQLNNGVQSKVLTRVQACLPPWPLTPLGVYIPPYTPSLQTIQWNTATLSSPVWVGLNGLNVHNSFPIHGHDAERVYLIQQINSHQGVLIYQSCS